MAGLSFSQADRWVNCTGSKQLLAKLPRSAQAPEAAEGTLAHEVAAATLTGAPLPATQVDSEMVEAAEGYAALVEMLRSAQSVTADTHVEQSFSHPLNKQVRGTADVLCDGMDVEGKPVLLVGDYKYGKGTPVSAEYNAQLMLTAVTYLRGLGRSASAYGGATLFIYQPRSMYGEPFSIWFASYETLVAYETQALAAAKLADSADATLTSGDWCKHCDAKVICPQFVESNLIPILDTPALEGLSLITLGELLAKGVAVEAWIKELKEYLKEAMHKGHNVQGWKMNTRKGTRTWVDESAADRALEHLIGDKRYKQTLKSPTQILKDYSELEETLKDLVQQPITRLLLRDSKKDGYNHE